MLSNDVYKKLEPLINCGADVNELDDFKEWLMPELKAQEKLMEEMVEFITSLEGLITYEGSTEDLNKRYILLKKYKELKEKQ